MVILAHIKILKIKIGTRTADIIELKKILKILLNICDSKFENLGKIENSNKKKCFTRFY